MNFLRKLYIELFQCNIKWFSLFNSINRLLVKMMVVDNEINARLNYLGNDKKVNLIHLEIN